MKDFIKTMFGDISFLKPSYLVCQQKGPSQVPGQIEALKKAEGPEKAEAPEDSYFSEYLKEAEARLVHDALPLQFKVPVVEDGRLVKMLTADRIEKIGGVEYLFRDGKTVPGYKVKAIFEEGAEGDEAGIGTEIPGYLVYNPTNTELDVVTADDYTKMAEAYKKEQPNILAKMSRLNNRVEKK